MNRTTRQSVIYLVGCQVPGAYADPVARGEGESQAEER